METSQDELAEEMLPQLTKPWLEPNISHVVQTWETLQRLCILRAGNLELPSWYGLHPCWRRLLTGLGYHIDPGVPLDQPQAPTTVTSLYSPRYLIAFRVLPNTVQLLCGSLVPHQLAME
jgi:hypothetical protein